jgi:two-component system response regulator RegA
MLDNSPQIPILLVEDDDALRERLSRAIRKRGFDVIEACGVGDALAKMEDAADLRHAIVDLSLQDGSGLDVISALRRRTPDARLLILTGYGDIPTAVAAVQLGAIDYLAKPEGADEILAALLSPKGKRPPPPTHPIEPDAARQTHIKQVFHDAGDNVSKAARLLNMHRRTLQRILKRAELRAGDEG